MPSGPTLHDEEEFEGDLSPLTVLLFGIAVSLTVFFTVKRIVDATDSKSKFRRRTRAEEEAILAQQQQQRQAAQVVAEHGTNEPADAWSGEEEEVDEADEGSENGMNAVEEESEASSRQDERPRALTKKELHKIEKRKRKQEQQEAWRHMIEREKQLRELREAEEREKEEFERQEAERAAAKYKRAPEPVIIRASETELNNLLETGPRFISIQSIACRFPTVKKEVLQDQIQKLLRRQQRDKYIHLSDGSVLRVDDDILTELDEMVRSKGFIEHETLANIILN